MSYAAEISRANPSAFLFLIDQSGSMQDAMGAVTNIQPLDKPVTIDGRTYTQSATGGSKAQKVADAVNRLLRELTIKCTKSEGVRDYYHIGVVGYGGSPTANAVSSAFIGPLAGRELAPISEIANNPARIEERAKKVDDGAGGLVEQKVKFPIWFEPVANGGTPMGSALKQAQTSLSEWVAKYPNGFPPICINITDGESNPDDDPMQPAEAVRSLINSDGNVLLFNIHISAQSGASVEFPDSDAGLPDEFAKRLFNMSSSLPSHMQSIARQDPALHITEGSRGFAFNADMVSLIRFLDIGTRPSNLR
jgi:hypothetical protein